ncbi:MAG: uridine diphosphate-N-acetylglucosamine-binding protein YvcK [Candidatus Omnitrophica bacterium]|nr:uridine diphosphate-N-acetylglucosamine-binding protein YvcK [Candidatus Omnitrophota bacterium]
MKQRVLVIGNKKTASLIEDCLPPYGIEVVNETGARPLQPVLRATRFLLVIYDEDSFGARSKRANSVIFRALKAIHCPFFVLSSRKTLASLYNAYNLGANYYIGKPFNHREFIARFVAAVNRKTRITCIGGGTGLFHMLLALKTFPNALLTSIVSMSDDGGSSGKLKTTFGILPPGDVRRSLVALSNAPEIMNKVMQYRFQRANEFYGHTFGNLFLTALSEIEGSLPNAIKTISDLLHAQGVVLPITESNTTLVACFEDGTVVKGESKIDLCEGRNPALNIREIWHEPETNCTIDAASAILNSDIIIIGPGDLFTSVITNLLVNNVRDLIARSRAKKIYIANLMTKPGETARYTAFDHVREIVRYMHGDCLDYVVLSNTGISRSALKKYAAKYQQPVSLEGCANIHKITAARVIVDDVGDETVLVRHDSSKLKRVIAKILKSERKRAWGRDKK